ncbi:MAG: LamG domain-containing protein [Terriglobia bacterium]
MVTLGLQTISSIFRARQQEQWGGAWCGPARLSPGMREVAMRNLPVVAGIAIAVCLAPVPVYGDCEGGPVFVETIVALGQNTIAWATPADINFVKGDLAALSTYTTWVRGSRTEATSLDISLDNPAPGKGLFYIVKPVGPPCGSWQTSPGAEPNRDALIDPPCSEVNPTHAEIEAAVTFALQGLQSPWTDPDDANIVYARIQDALGCAVEEPPHLATASEPAALASLSDCDTTYCNVINYCGVSNSSNLIALVWPATQCLNQACFQHDTCSRDICVHTLCSFSAQSDTECDTALFAACATCAGGGVAYVTDDIVCEIAESLAATLDPAFCSDPPCSDPGRQCNPTAGTCCFTAEGLRPLAWWKADGDAMDAAGASHGTLVNGVTFESGLLGQAFSFDGIDDYVDFGDVLNSLAVPFTIEGWIRISGTQDYQDIFNSDDTGSVSSGNYFGFWFRIYQRRVEVTYGDGTGAGPGDRRTKYSAMLVPLDTWTHVAGAVRGPTDMSLYVNGNEAGGTYEGSGGPMAHNTFPARMGIISRWIDDHFRGAIDEVGVHSRALTQEEIQAIVMSGHLGTCP